MKNNLTAEEICSIITICGEARVAKLEFRDLRVEFSPKVADSEESTQFELVGNIPRTNLALSSSPENEISENQKSEEKDSLVNDELRIREEQLAELFVTDPKKAEELLINGDLEELLNGNDGDT